MIQITLRLQTDIEHSPAILKALRTIAVSSKLERGCLRSEVLQDTNDTCLLQYAEEWESEEELNRQIRSERFTRLLALMEAASEPPEFQLRFIDSICGLEYVEAHRR